MLRSVDGKIKGFVIEPHPKPVNGPPHPGEQRGRRGVDLELELRRGHRASPACHGTDVNGNPAYFGADPYEDFVQRVVANKRFQAWDIDGPETAEPGPGIGLLHHHLGIARPSCVTLHSA
jgi:hypothetical protein